MVELPRPRLTILPGEPGLELWRIDFGNGAIGEVWIDPDDRSAWPSPCCRWRVSGPGLEADGHSYARDRAVRALWCLAAQLSAPPPIEGWSGRTALELAHRAELGDAVEAADVLRQLLARRTGRRWSVRAGRGRSIGTITIASLPSARVGKAVSAADAALLAAVLRVSYVGAGGYTVPKRHGARCRAVLAIVGLSAAELDRLDWRTVRAAVEREPSVSVH